jgi:hypothetical protein
MRAFARVVGAGLVLGLGIAGGSNGIASAATTYSFAVIGDLPYGNTELSLFPAKISQINADPDVRMVGHLGDIGSGNCSTSYYQGIKAKFETFADPLVYTPGDNEWADCHRASVGRANPLERLSAVRSIFYPIPGRTLGQNKLSVTAQSGYRENVSFAAGGLTVATLHVVGSENDLQPWTGLGFTTATTAQVSEESARVAAVTAQIRNAFSAAKAANSRAVVLMTQADMFVGTPNAGYRNAFQSVVRTIASESKSFQRPVFLFNGDSHNYLKDRPLTTSKWLSFYGVSGSVPNLTRVTIEGAAGVNEWVKANVVPGPEVLQIQRVAFR